MNWLRGADTNAPATNECEEKWEDGLYRITEQENLQYLVGVRFAHNCHITVDGKLFILQTANMRKEEFLEQIPILTERPTEPGVYTYIVYSNSEINKGFAACKTNSVLELGTVHKAIAYRVKAERIHAAGEILVSSSDVPELLFNFMSGTYMGPTFEEGARKRRSRCPVDELEDLLIVKLKQILGSDAKWSSMKTFVTSKFVPVTREELAFYESFGAVLTLYDSADECFKAKGGRRQRFRTMRRHAPNRPTRRNRRHN